MESIPRREFGKTVVGEGEQVVSPTLNAAVFTQGDDEQSLRHLYGRFPSGLATLAVSGSDPLADPTLMVVSTLQVGVSIEPPLVAVAIARSSTSWPILRNAERVGVSVLAETHAAAVRALSSRGPGRFRDVELAAGGSGDVYVEGAVAWMSCIVYAEHEAGDHCIVVLLVEAADVDPLSSPLVFHGSAFHAIATLPHSRLQGQPTP